MSTSLHGGPVVTSGYVAAEGHHHHNMRSNNAPTTATKGNESRPLANSNNSSSQQQPMDDYSQMSHNNNNISARRASHSRKLSLSNPLPFTLDVLDTLNFLGGSATTRPRRPSFGGTLSLGGIDLITTNTGNVEDTAHNFGGEGGHGPASGGVMSSSSISQLESQFCKDFECCGAHFPSLHELLAHYETVHVNVNTWGGEIATTTAYSMLDAPPGAVDYDALDGFVHTKGAGVAHNVAQHLPQALETIKEEDEASGNAPKISYAPVSLPLSSISVPSQAPSSPYISMIGEGIRQLQLHEPSAHDAAYQQQQQQHTYMDSANSGALASSKRPRAPSLVEMNLPMDDGKKLRAAANVGRLIAKPAGTAAAVGAAKPAAPESAKDKTANANANGNAQNAAPTAAGQRNTGLTSQSDQSDASSFSATPSPPFNDFGVPRHYNGPSAVTHNPYHPSPLQVQHPIQGSDTGIAYNATGLFIPHLANSPHQQHQRPQQHQQQQEQQQFRLQDDGNQQAHPSPLMPTHPMLYAPQPRHAAFSDIQRSNTPPVFPAQHHFQIEAPVRPTSTPVDGSFQQQQQQQQQQQMYAQQQWGYEQQQQQGQGQGGDEGYAQGAATPGKKYKCPKPFCSKVYKNSNGLKYHLEHGNCELDYEHHAAASSAMSSQGSPLLSAATPAPHPNHPRTSSPSPSDYMHPSPAMPHANMGAAAAAAAAHPEFATPYYLPPNSPHTSTLYTHQLDPHNHNHPYNTHPQQHPNYPYAALQGQQQFTPAPYLPFTSNLPLFSPLGLSQLSPGLAAAHAQDIKIALRPYWCRVQGCGKKYKNLNGLKYHAKVCHKDMDFKTEVKGHTSMNL